MLQNLAHAHASSFNFGIGISRIFRNIFAFQKLSLFVIRSKCVFKLASFWAYLND